MHVFNIIDEKYWLFGNRVAELSDAQRKKGTRLLRRRFLRTYFKLAHWTLDMFEDQQFIRDQAISTGSIWKNYRDYD